MIRAAEASRTCLRRSLVMEKKRKIVWKVSDACGKKVEKPKKRRKKGNGHE